MLRIKPRVNRMSTLTISLRQNETETVKWSKGFRTNPDIPKIAKKNHLLHSKYTYCTSAVWSRSVNKTPKAKKTTSIRLKRNYSACRMSSIQFMLQKYMYKKQHLHSYFRSGRTSTLFMSNSTSIIGCLGSNHHIHTPKNNPTKFGYYTNIHLVRLLACLSVAIDGALR